MEVNIIISLLTIIAVSEVTRLILTHKKTGKKAYFKQRLEGTERLIWDLEFKAFKTREIREDVRKEYSDMKARIHSLDEQIKNWPKEKDEAERKRAEDQKVLAERDAQRFETQMEQLDIEVEGTRPTDKYPDGVTGIVQQIGSLKEVQTMIKDWMKSI